MKPVAVLPAGGLSSRMGSFKPLLDLGGMSVLARSVRTFLDAGVERVLVVTGNRDEEVAAEARRAGAETVHNPDWEQGMFTTVRAGVRALDDGQDFFMHPADIPLVRPQTVRLIMQAHAQSGPLLTCPTFLGERGHPPLLGHALRPMVLNYGGQGGLRGLLESLPADQVLELPCADAGILADLDRPEDHAAALKRMDRAYPDERECRALWELCGTPENVRAHSLAVAKAAVRLAEAVNARGGSLDADLVYGASLAHDILRVHKGHARLGAAMLDLHGFTAAVPLVAEHPDLELPADQPVTEREMVFLADKYVQGEELVPLEARYQAKLIKFGAEPGARENIQGRLDRARAVRDRVQELAGRDLETLLEIA